MQQRMSCAARCWMTWNRLWGCLVHRRGHRKESLANTLMDHARTTVHFDPGIGGLNQNFDRCHLERS